jgi:hypothetical protein
MIGRPPPAAPKSGHYGMLVSPLHGVKGNGLLHQLRDLGIQLGNLNSIGTGHPDGTAWRLWAYLESSRTIGRSS